MSKTDRFNDAIPTEAVHAMHSMIAQAKRVRPDGWGFVILMAKLDDGGAIVCTHSMDRAEALFILTSYCLEAIEHDQRVKTDAQKEADAAGDNQRG